jgi:formylmethanofuran--tetrahydromethanopterin N-formyltransferase
MEVNGVYIEDTYAEAFTMQASRILVTALNEKWALEAARSMTGFATSVIGCGSEAGIEGTEVKETLDGRLGVSILLFATSKKGLQDQLVRRIGQSIMTTPTSACFNGLQGQEWVSVGGKLRFFGDGFQISKVIDAALNKNGFETYPEGRERRFWRIPVMDGEFLIEDKFGVTSAVGGGNFLILGEHTEITLQAAERAIEAMKKVPEVIMPFPGGIVRSGSKVGSKYKFLTASSNTSFCPTIRKQVPSQLPDGVGSVLEIVIDGLTPKAVSTAMSIGIQAACIPGIKKITAGNYGGKLGKHHFYLRKILGELI